MSLEIRTEALKIAAGLHADADTIIATAEKFYGYLKTEVKAVEGAVASVMTRKNKTTPAQPAQPAAPAAAAPPSAAAVPASSSSIDHEAVKGAVITLVKEGDKAGAIKILAKYGAEKAPQVKVEDLAKVHADLTTAIAAAVAAKG